MFCWGDTFAHQRTSFGTAPSMSLDEGKSGCVPRMAPGLTNRRCDIPQIFGTIGRGPARGILLSPEGKKASHCLNGRIEE